MLPEVDDELLRGPGAIGQLKLLKLEVIRNCKQKTYLLMQKYKKTHISIIRNCKQKNILGVVGLGWRAPKMSTVNSLEREYLNLWQFDCFPGCIYP